MGVHTIEEIYHKLRQNVSSHRYTHTLGVIDAAIYLAKKYGENEEAAYMAALLHDYAKDFSKEQLEEYMRQNNLEVDEIMANAYQLIHGKVAAHIAKYEFNIYDENILNAIEYHTTGRREMSKLEKIIYLADFIELGRNYIGVEELRMIAEKDLDAAVLQAINNTISYVLSMGGLLHTNTVEARNSLLYRDKQH